MAATTATKSSNATTAASANAEDLAKQVDALKSDIANLTRTLGEYGKAQGEYFAREARKGARDVKSAGEAQLDLMISQATDVGKQAEDFVAQKPGIALGIAAGAGFLIGLITSRR